MGLGPNSHVRFAMSSTPASSSSSTEEVENLMIQSFGEVPSNLAGVVIMLLEGKAIMVLGLLDWLKE